MLKLIVGLKGSGKTKTLIEMSNKAYEDSKGSVVCIEMGSKLIYDIKHQVRLIDTVEYGIDNASALYGFVTGITASNHDVTDVFVDSALKICKNDLESFTDMVLKLDKFAIDSEINIVMTCSVEKEKIPASIADKVLN